MNYLLPSPERGIEITATGTPASGIRGLKRPEPERGIEIVMDSGGNKRISTSEAA